MTSAALRASKWLSFQMLLDPIEMEALLTVLEPIELYRVGAPIALEEKKRTREQFLHAYAHYCTELKQGRFVDVAFFKKEFANVLTADERDIFFKPLEDGRWIGTVVRPVITMQLHAMGYSEEEGVFRPMVHGLNTITWGVFLCFPQLYQDSETGEVVEALKQGLPNALKFKKLRRFIQEETKAACFMIDEKSVQTTVRIGKKAMKWAHCHPQLVERSIGVK